MSQNNQWGQQPPQDQWGQQQPQQQWGQQPPQDQWVQPPPPQQQWGQPPQQPYYGPPQKTGGCLKWFLIIGAVLVVLCGIAGFLFYRFGKGIIEDTQKPVTAFMQAGQNNDFAAARAVSTSTIKDEEIRTMFEQRELFEGFQSISLPTGFDANQSTNSGTMQMTGPIIYSSGPNGTYEAVLTYDGKEWKLAGIHIRR